MRTSFSCLVICCLVFSGFEGRKKVRSAEFIPGTYGVSESSSHIVLTINKNGTYSYIDKFARPAVKLDGSWTRTDNVIVLNGTGEIKVHNRWKIDNDQPCLKARKGMEWRRLCLVKPE